MAQGALLASFVGGLAAALGHAPFSLPYLALAGLAVAIWSVSEAPNGKSAAFRAWLAGAAYFAVTLHWIVEPFLVDAATHGWMAPGALILLAGGLALFWGIAGWLANWFGGRATQRALVFAIALTAAELLRGHIFTGFPWAMPAYIWTETPIRAVVAYIGSYGLTFMTLLCAAVLAVTPQMRWMPAFALLMLGALALGSQARLQTLSEPSELGRVALIHPNVPQTEKWVREKVPGHIDRLLELTREAARGEDPVDLVVWPEVAVVYPLHAASNVLAAAAEASAGTPVITGINRRTEEAWFNSLVQVNADGHAGTVYDKVHLVPFGEYIPFRLGILRAMAATSSNGFSSGEAVRLIETPLGKALPLICYEGIFPGHAFRAKGRADYILLITNDAWFGAFAGPFQHLDQARFRAAEHGLPVVRVANAGVSAVIDRFGNIETSLGIDGRGQLQAGVTSGPPTLYARMGDLPLIILLGIIAMALLVTKRRNTIANRNTSV